MDTENINKVLATAGEKIVEAMVNNLLDNGSLGTGALAKSINYEIIEDDKSITLQINLLEYGKWVDAGIGRGPGKRPPLQPILDWIKKKGIRIPAPFKNARGFAFVIQKNIGDRGTNPRPRPFIQKSFIQVKNQYLDEALNQAGAQDIEIYLSRVFKDNGAKLV